MSAYSRRPRWWLLYSIFPVTIFLLWLIARDGLPDWANEWFTIGVVLVVAALVEIWLTGHALSLLREPAPGFGLASDGQSAASAQVTTPASGKVRGFAEPPGKPPIIGCFVSAYGTLPVYAHQAPAAGERRA